MPYSLWPFVAATALLVLASFAWRTRVGPWAGVLGVAGLLAVATNGAPPFATPAVTVDIGPYVWWPISVTRKPNWIAAGVIGGVAVFVLAWLGELVKRRLPVSAPVAIALAYPLAFALVMCAPPALRHVLGPQEQWKVHCSGNDGRAVEGLADELLIYDTKGMGWWALRDVRDPAGAPRRVTILRQDHLSCTHVAMQASGS